MHVFRRKSTAERIIDAVTSTAAAPTVRRVTAWALGLLGGAAAATAASSAVSSARSREAK
jgi:hypothetical protein